MSALILSLRTSTHSLQLYNTTYCTAYWDLTSEHIDHCRKTCGRRPIATREARKRQNDFCSGKTENIHFLSPPDSMAASPRMNDSVDGGRCPHARFARHARLSDGVAGLRARHTTPQLHHSTITISSASAFVVSMECSACRCISAAASPDAVVMPRTA